MMLIYKQLYQLGLRELNTGLEFRSFWVELISGVPGWLAQRAKPVQLTQTQLADLDRRKLLQMNFGICKTPV